MFHAHSGWYFNRGEDGSVSIWSSAKRIITALGLEHEAELVEVVRFDKDTWASIVGSVSNKADPGEAFEMAEQLHSL